MPSDLDTMKTLTTLAEEFVEDFWAQEWADRTLFIGVGGTVQLGETDPVPCNSWALTMACTHSMPMDYPLRTRTADERMLMELPPRSTFPPPDHKSRTFQERQHHRCQPQRALFRRPRVFLNVRAGALKAEPSDSRFRQKDQIFRKSRWALQCHAHQQQGLFRLREGSWNG